MPERYWSSLRGKKRTLHRPELVEKAVKTANWRENRAQQVFLTPPVTFEEQPVHDGQRAWFCNALRALTREELIELYDTVVETAKECLEDGGDFTPPDVRARHPHIYAEVADREPS